MTNIICLFRCSWTRSCKAKLPNISTKGFYYSFIVAYEVVTTIFPPTYDELNLISSQNY